MRRGITIDVHAHMVPDAYLHAVEKRADSDPDFAELAQRNNLLPQPADGPMRDLSQLLKQMDDASIDIAVLSLPPPGAAIRAGDADLAAAINDDLVALARLASDRLRVLCVLPLPDPDASMRELERSLSLDLVRGVGVTTNLIDWRLDEPELDRVYAKVADSGVPLFVHPALEPVPAAYDDFGLTAAVAPVVSTTVSLLRLILSGTFDRVPGLTAIVPHLGGLLPYLLQRALDLTRGSRAAFSLEHYLRERLYFDSCSLHPPAFRCAADTVGIERIVLGSDYPFRGTLARLVADVAAQGLGEQSRAAVLGETAAGWFA